MADPSPGNARRRLGGVGSVVVLAAAWTALGATPFIASLLGVDLALDPRTRVALEELAAVDDEPPAHVALGRAR